MKHCNAGSSVPAELLKKAVIFQRCFREDKIPIKPCCSGPFWLVLSQGPPVGAEHKGPLWGHGLTLSSVVWMESLLQPSHAWEERDVAWFSSS